MSVQIARIEHIPYDTALSDARINVITPSFFREFGDFCSLCAVKVNHVVARTYLQPYYGNGVFGNVYLSAGQD